LKKQGNGLVREEVEFPILRGRLLKNQEWAEDLKKGSFPILRGRLLKRC